MREKIAMDCGGVQCARWDLKAFNSAARPLLFTLCPLLLVWSLSGCDTGISASVTSQVKHDFEISSIFKTPELDEISGIQAGTGTDFFVHNDEGKALLHVVRLNGQHVAAIKIKDAKNRDWEDIARIQRDDGNLLVMGDIGDNKNHHKSIRLYFVAEPVADQDDHYPGKIKLRHELKARFPDGPRDCEAMAYDPFSKQILFLSKRDRPPRLYALPIETALGQDKVELEFLAEVPTFRPPTPKDDLLGGKRGRWVSQPTGMDISSDGKHLAVITYRSLYLWSRKGEESWAEVFQKVPTEFIGPPGLHDEAVTFGHHEGEVYVTTEGVPTPLYRLQPDL